MHEGSTSVEEGSLAGSCPGTVPRFHLTPCGGGPAVGGRASARSSSRSPAVVQSPPPSGARPPVHRRQPPSTPPASSPAFSYQTTPSPVSPLASLALVRRSDVFASNPSEVDLTPEPPDSAGKLPNSACGTYSATRQGQTPVGNPTQPPESPAHVPVSTSIVAPLVPPLRLAELPAVAVATTATPVPCVTATAGAPSATPLVPAVLAATPEAPGASSTPCSALSDGLLVATPSPDVGDASCSPRDPNEDTTSATRVPPALPRCAPPCSPDISPAPLAQPPAPRTGHRLRRLHVPDPSPARLGAACAATATPPAGDSSQQTAEQVLPTLSAQGSFAGTLPAAPATPPADGPRDVPPPCAPAPAPPAAPRYASLAAAQRSGVAGAAGDEAISQAEPGSANAGHRVSGRTSAAATSRPPQRMSGRRGTAAAVRQVTVALGALGPLEGGVLSQGSNGEPAGAPRGREAAATTGDGLYLAGGQGRRGRGGQPGKRMKPSEACFGANKAGLGQ